MITKNKGRNEFDLFRLKLENQLEMKHPLCVMAQLIDWQKFDKEFSKHYCEDNGRPSKPIRLMVSLEFLKQMYGLSDEEIVNRWLENPYWQYFGGEEYFQTSFPVDASLMVRFRERINKEGMNLLLKETIRLGLATRTVERRSFKKVIVDTTVQEKNIIFPTDARSQNKIREKLVRFAEKVGIKLRQKYGKMSVKKLVEGARYAHARQMKRAKKALKKVRVYLGRVMRDMDRKWEHVREGVEKVLQDEYGKLKKIAKTLVEQRQSSKEKIYSVHEPHVECISKGKVHKKYEFGVKVGIGVTHREGFVVASDVFFGNPYDGHTLAKSLYAIEENTTIAPTRCYVDKGYRGHKVKAIDVFISGQRRGVSATRRREIKRRSLVEAMISHMKRKCHLGRNYLHGMIGDENNAVLSGVGHNLRLICAKVALNHA